MDNDNNYENNNDKKNEYPEYKSGYDEDTDDNIIQNKLL